MSEVSATPGQGDEPAQGQAGWVKFEDAAAPAVLPTETSQVSPQTPQAPHTRVQLQPPPTRHGFANGDLVVTLLPVNARWPWITPAHFRPELVPEELMARDLTLTVEEYVQIMERLVNDVRFTLYNICYKRVLVGWIVMSFVVLMGLLFSGLNNLARFSFGVVWLLLNVITVFICMWIKLQLLKGLERCMARVNKQLMKHKLLMTLDDRGRISCHKVTLCFLYFDPAPCISHLERVIERDGAEAIPAGWERRLDVDEEEIVIQGNQTTRISRKQERAVHLYLRYSSRWGARAAKGKIDISMTNAGRHSPVYSCPCQFIEEHLYCKPPGGILKFCPSPPVDNPFLLF